MKSSLPFKLNRIPLHWRFTTCALVIFFLVEVLAFEPPVPPEIRGLNVSVQPVSGGATLHIAVDSGDQTVNVVAIPLEEAKSLPTIYEFNDPSYPTTGASSFADLRGIQNHLESTAAVHGASLIIQTIGATQLAQLFADRRDAQGRLVLLATGDMPSTVWSASLDLVNPWMRAGGTVVWVGDPPGNYSVGRGSQFILSAPPAPQFGAGCLSVEPQAQVVFAPAVSALGTKGITRFFGTLPLGPTGRWPLNPFCVATLSTSAASSLGLQYTSDFDGMPLAFLSSRHGVSLGAVAVGQASLSYFPVENGGFMMFGGSAVGNSTIIANDLFRVLMSRVTLATGPLVWRKIHGRVNEKIAVPATLRGKGLQVTVLDPSETGTYLKTEFLATVVRPGIPGDSIRWER